MEGFMRAKFLMGAACDQCLGSAAQQAQSDQPIYQYLGRDVMGLVEGNAKTARGYGTAVGFTHKIV